MTNRTERIMKEFNKLKNSQSIHILKCEFINGDINNWYVAFEGPPTTVYEDGIFKVRVNLPDNFPKGNPNLFFITKMFHPNINSKNGAVSLNIIKPHNWVETRTMQDVFFGLIDIMENPTNAGCGEEAGKLLLQNRDKFFDKVLEYTDKYAMEDP